MLRVLMVLEDYGELLFLQTVLKKIGFDVEAIQNPRLFGDSVLTLNPDVLIMTGAGKRVRGLELARTVKRTRGLPHVILIRGQGAGAEEADPHGLVGATLNSPVGAKDLLNSIGDLCGLDKAMLSEKFGKLRLSEAPEEPVRVLHYDENESRPNLERAETPSGNFGTLADSSMGSEERAARYKKVLDLDRPEHVGFGMRQVQEQIKGLRKEERPEDLAALELERKAFVEELFKKGKG